MAQLRIRSNWSKYSSAQPLVPVATNPLAPSCKACSFLASVLEKTYGWAPKAAAIWTARCPRPPRPSTATFGFSPFGRSVGMYLFRGDVASLRNIAIGINAVVRGDRVLTVLFVVLLAPSAAQTSKSLGSQADSVANLVQTDFGTHVDHFANDLVAHNLRKLDFSPSFAAHRRHDVGPAKTTTLNFDVNVVVAKGLGLVRDVLGLVPVLGVKHGKTSKFLRVVHRNSHCSR
ncbi:hypothetical protein OGATHE_003903 [Ogataea polymorpha]|uniref:Uncharacterized protein n=1 Tax=Ogataea polymorpha TaxID=460523 RepID=A0A9P8T3N4_9ASCO|nr:hypothetical protein OGATHE_003903 [Ogataea polymorpha]